MRQRENLLVFSSVIILMPFSVIKKLLVAIY